MASSTGKNSRGVLYVVATPIGNLEDITIRAIRVLSEVDLVACEDTRRTARLLAAHGIGKPLLSYFEHNEHRRAAEIVARLKEGARVALVTDAGTPAISDPGFRLVRGAIEAGIRVTAVPGPSAVAAALSIAGLPTDRFAFEGFLPPKGPARIKFLESLARETRTIVFYEAARRLSATLNEMATAFGEDRAAAVVREMTKTFEETIRGTLGELARRFAAEPALGEITLVVAGARAAEGEPTAGAQGPEITAEMLCEAGLGLKAASDLIARLTNRSRREVYQEALRAKRLGGRS